MAIVVIVVIYIFGSITASEVRNLETLIHSRFALHGYGAAACNIAPCIQLTAIVDSNAAAGNHIDMAIVTFGHTGCHRGILFAGKADCAVNSDICSARHGQRAIRTRRFSILRVSRRGGIHRIRSISGNQQGYATGDSIITRRKGTIVVKNNSLAGRIRNRANCIRQSFVKIVVINQKTSIRSKHCLNGYIFFRNIAIKVR